jgi:hypothetical protein
MQPLPTSVFSECNGWCNFRCIYVPVQAVLVAKGQVSNKIADRHAKPKEMGVDGSLSLNR